MNDKKITEFYLKIQEHCNEIEARNKAIKTVLDTYANGKKLKGDELVGWLGEIYGKLILGGEIHAADDKDYDIFTEDKRVSVKARKGDNAGWTRSSIIPRIDLTSADDPTHLLFVHLKNDYSLKSAWLFSWDWLVEKNRFIEKKVRGKFVGHYFSVKPEADIEFLCWPTDGK